MPDFVIKISTPADLSGAQAAQIAMDAIAKATGTVTTGAEQAAQATGRFTDSAGRLREANGQFVATGKSAGEAAKQIGEAERATHGLAGALEGGIGLGLGERFLDAVSEIPAKFQEIMEKGVEYNAMMQTQAIGLGVSLRQMDPEKYLNFDTARTAGEATLDLLRTKANSLGLSFEELAHTFSVALPTLVEAGVTKTADQIDVLIRLQQMATKNGFTGGQATKDILDELLGRVERTNFGRELEAQGLTKKAIDDAREAGTTAEVILGKTSAMAEAAEAKANSYAGALETIHNQLDQLAGDVAKPAFDKLLGFMQGGKGALGSTDAQGIATGLGNSIGGAIDGLESSAKTIEAFWDRHPWLKKLNETLNLATPEGLLFSGVKDNIDAGSDNTEVDAQIKLVKGLQEKISNAKDDKAVAEARKELETAIAAASERTASAQGDAKDRAEQFLVVLQAIQASFGTQVGTAPIDNSAANARAKREAEAESSYQNSPEKELADARASGDQNAIDDAEFKAKVAQRAPQIQKKFPGLSPEEATKHAEEEVDAADQQKQDADAAREKKRDDDKAKADKDRADEKAQREAQAAADDAKQRADTIASEDAEIAILEAKKEGNTTLADQLQRQLDIQREIQRLMSSGLSYDDAASRAERTVDLKADIKDEYHTKSTGGSDDRTTYGFRDPDKAGGLHTETLAGHAGSADRFAGIPDAATAALAAAPTAADTLATAKNYVPSFPTATSLLAPALAGSNGSRPDDIPPTDDGNPPGGGAAGSFSSAASSADQAKSGLNNLSSVQSAAQTLSQSLSGLAQSLSGIDLASTLSDMQDQIDGLQTVVNDLQT